MILRYWVIHAVVLSAGLVLAQPQTPFTEEAQIRGIDYTPNQLWDVVPFGDGLAFVDLDGDGDPDAVILGRPDGLIGIYENDGTGFFTDRSAANGVPLAENASGVVAGDYDRDGDLDLYISRWARANLLLRNDGSFSFTEVTTAAGVGDPGKGTGCAWGDFDGDGWLDLYVSNREVANLLYRNLGDGSFEDVAGPLGVTQADQPTFQASFFDFDRDGDADLYLANDRGMLSCQTFHNFLFENTGGLFVDITDSSNTHACADAMSIGIGDFDRNGFQDLYSTSQELGNALLMNQGDGTFIQDEIPAGVISNTVGWGAVFFDYDNDSHSDLYVCNMLEENRLYRHEGVWPCEDVSEPLAVDDAGSSFVVATADIDDDGDLDMLVSNRDTPIRLYVNHEGEKRGWVKFDVVGLGQRRQAIGANVEIRTGSVPQLREVIAGNNYKSQNQLTLHFGVGDATMIDEIGIVWNGGTSRVLTNLSANETWVLYPTEKLGDVDHNGERDFEDFIAFSQCYGTHMPGSITPGCEVFDFQGDGDVDLLDFDGFLAVFDGPQHDCDDNGIPDLRDILNDPQLDQNANGLIDACECIFDVNQDGQVNQLDLALVATQWLQSKSVGDVNLDGSVDILDLIEVVSHLGPCLLQP